MTGTEAVFLWISVWLYGLSFLSYLIGAVFRKERWLKWGVYLTIAGFITQTLSMGVRWHAVKHPPVKGTYENSMLGSWFMLASFLSIAHRYRRVLVSGVVVMPMVFLMIGNGVMGRPVLEPLSPPYRSNWLWLHVFFAWVAYGAFCIGAVMGAVFLMKERSEKKGGLAGFRDRLPGKEVMNDLTLRTIIFGFVALTVEIGAGAIWAYGLWGRYWGWDPIETWSLITWLVYGTYIHLGVTLGWKGRKMAWLAIVALFFVFITFGGIGYLGGIHTTIL